MLCLGLLLLAVGVQAQGEQAQAIEYDCTGATAEYIKRKLAGKKLTVQMNGETLESDDDSTYLIELGARGEIIQTHGENTYSIGKHIGFQEDNAMIENFDNGDLCWEEGESFARKATVTYSFGDETKMLEANEDEPCVYSFKVQIAEEFCEIVSGEPFDQYAMTKGVCGRGVCDQDPTCTYYGDRDCKARCDEDLYCTGFTLSPIMLDDDDHIALDDQWCETYTAKGAYGDGDEDDFGTYCYMKKFDCAGYNVEDLKAELADGSLSVKKDKKDKISYVIEFGEGGKITLTDSTDKQNVLETSLGNHVKYDAEGGKDGMVEVFEDGAECTNDQDSKVKSKATVTYSFGDETKILEVNEPETCVYTLKVQIARDMCLCKEIKESMDGDGSRIWEDRDVRVKNGDKTRDIDIRREGEGDPMCECIDLCKDHDIFVYSVRADKRGDIWGRCKCWSLPKRVNKGTVRTKGKHRGLSAKYQLGAITAAGKLAIENGMKQKSGKKFHGFRG